MKSFRCKLLSWFRQMARMMPTAGIFLFLNTSPLQAVEDLNAGSKTLQILQLGFNQKTVSLQRTLLRDMARINDPDSIPFFAKVALSNTYEDEVRREALKAILSLDTKKYRIMLDPLQTDPLDGARVVQAIQVIDQNNLLEPFLSSLTFQEERRVTTLKMLAVLRFWKEKTIDSFDFSTWPSAEASAELLDLIQSTRATGQKAHLIQLWGKVRDEKTTKEMIKLLDQDNPKIQEALIFALSEPGSSTVSALGRFLQKSKNPILRKRAIFGLRKINTPASKTALQSYESKATKDEKVWISEILSGSKDAP